MDDVYEENGVTLKRIEHLTPFIPVSTIAWSQDGHHITSSGILRTGEVVWDTKTWKPVMTATKEFSDVGGVGFSPDGQYLITSESSRGTPGNKLFATVWEVQSGKAVRHLKGYSSNPQANNLKFVLPVLGDKYVIIGNATSLPDDIHVLDTTTWEFVRSFGEQYNTAVSMALSPSGPFLAIGQFEGVVAVWDYSTGQKVTDFVAHPGTVESIAYSPDGNYIITGGNNAIFVRDKETGEGSWGQDGDFIRVWDAATLTKVRSYRIDRTRSSVRAITVSADGSVIAAGIGYDLYILDGQSSRILMTQRMPFIIGDVAFAPDTSVLAVGGGTNLVVWSVEVN